MTNEITISKQEFALVLNEAGLNVSTNIPERVIPPIVILNASSPYLVRSSLQKEFYLNLDCILVSATATNTQSTEKLEDLMEAFINALPPYARLLTIGQPFSMQTNNAEYLSATASVELSITI